jgi:hypothetical protein
MECIRECRNTKRMQHVHLGDYFVGKSYRFIFIQAKQSGNEIIIKTLIKYFYFNGYIVMDYRNVHAICYNKFYYYALAIYGRINIYDSFLPTK